ncbi:MAG: crossover junction endodeoxyribonuclease RuvC [Planctomycetota bacterium]|jgi:crossover junction endodeoxyribonuclease RuvC
MTAMRVLGIDPGTQLAGWAVVDRQADGACRYVASGVLRLGRSPEPIPTRLAALHRGLESLFEEHDPQALVLEGAFFGLNARSALRLGEARGVVLLAAAAHDCPVREIPPATVKARVAGAGQASKEQVQRLVGMHLVDAPEEFASADEADALAIALCLLLEPVQAGEEAGRRSGRGSSRLPPGARFQ